MTDLSTPHEEIAMIRARPQVINFISSIQPTLEGLFLASVKNGKTGEVMIRYHQSQVDEVMEFLTYLESAFPDHIERL